MLKKSVVSLITTSETLWLKRLVIHLAWIWHFGQVQNLLFQVSIIIPLLWYCYIFSQSSIFHSLYTLYIFQLQYIWNRSLKTGSFFIICFLFFSGIDPINVHWMRFWVCQTERFCVAALHGNTDGVRENLDWSGIYTCIFSFYVIQQSCLLLFFNNFNTFLCACSIFFESYKGNV